MTKKTTTTSTAVGGGVTNFEEFKKTFISKSKSNINGAHHPNGQLQIEENTIEGLKRKYIELKDKVTTIKKLRFTETEHLFEEFKICAEQRDSDARKLISKLKRELENSLNSNKILTDTLTNTSANNTTNDHRFNFDEIKKDIKLSVQEDHNNELSLVKSTYDEKILQLQSKNDKLTLERDQLSDKLKLIELEFQQFKEQQEIQKQQEQQQREQKEQKEQEEQQTQQTQEQELKQEKEEEQQLLQVPQPPIFLPQTSTMLLEQQDTIENYKIEIASLKSIIQELKVKFDQENKEASKRYQHVVTKCEERLKEGANLLIKLETEKTDLVGKYQELSSKLQERSTVHKEFLIEKNNEIEQLEHQLKSTQKELASAQELQKQIDDLNLKNQLELSKQLDDCKLEIQAIEKKNLLDFEEYEQKISKANEESCESIKQVVNDLADVKAELSKCNLSLKDQETMLEAYKFLTATSVILVSDNKFELVCQNQANGSRVHGIITINPDDMVFYDPITVDKSDSNSDPNESFLSSRIEFTKDQSVAFTVKLIESIFIK